MTAALTAPRLHRLEPAELLYGRLLASAAVGGEPIEARIRIADGRLHKLPLRRWLAPVDAADRAVLAHAAAPVLDIGCGPGRHLAALAAAGHEGLGIDLSPVAVRLARARGAEAILRSVFADVPRAGEWRSALLLDGNIGIGGAPAALLARARDPIVRGGALLVETGPPSAPTRRVRVRLEAPGAISPWFGWAAVGARGIEPLARAAGLQPRATIAAGGRWFVRLERAR
jgi:SAM-dependent methyltransferase